MIPKELNRPHMDIEELVALYSSKVEEKWRVLSLDTCREELEPQHEAIKEFFRQYKN